ncbi:MAG: hypothetical protein ABSB79_07540 [Syntrophales bacterium]
MKNKLLPGMGIIICAMVVWAAYFFTTLQIYHLIRESKKSK